MQASYDTDDGGFQTSASAQGREFEQTAATVLKITGWSIVETHAKVAQAEIDIVADAPDGTRWWIECKGSWRGNVPGARRGDTVKKAVGVAWYLSLLPERCPYMLITSHRPNPGTLGALMLAEAERTGLFSEIHTIASLADSTMRSSA